MVISKHSENIISLTREGVVLQNDLMNDPTAWFPEANTILGSTGGQEVVDLLIDVLGPRQVLVALNLSLDEMVAVDGGGHGHLGQATADELQHGHLGGGVLHGHAVRSEAEVAGASLYVLPGGVIEVGVEDLLGQGQGPPQSLLYNLQVGDQFLVWQRRVLVEF